MTNLGMFKFCKLEDLTQNRTQKNEISTKPFLSKHFCKQSLAITNFLQSSLHISHFQTFIMFIQILLVALLHLCYQSLLVARPLVKDRNTPTLFTSTSSRFMPCNKISSVTLSAITSARKTASKGDALVGTTPLGYNFDPCKQHSDCIADRLCLTGNLESSCNGREPCLCLGQSVQLCEKNCTECENYPRETCGYLPEDVKAKKTPTGICLSAYTVFEGLVVEIGCDSFPDITPFPYHASQ